MSEKDAKDAAAPAPAGGKKKGGAIGVIVGILVTAALSGGAAFGGARMAAGHQPKPEPVEKPKYVAPGVTVALEAFIANVQDAEGKQRTVKVTVAIELEKEAKEEEFKPFIPRIRDATLVHIRGRSWEEMTKQEGIEAMRKELLEKYHAVGAVQARQVLVTDLIGQ